MKTFILALSALAVLSWSSPIAAHSGGTDANGCHRDHKRGGYHCH